MNDSTKTPFWQRPGYFQGTVRFGLRRLKSMADTLATIVVIGTVVCGYLGYKNPELSPVTFEKVIGEVVSVGLEGDNELPTIVISNDDDTSTYKRMDGNWSQIVQSELGTQVLDASELYTVLQSVFRNHQMGVEPVDGEILKVSTCLPRLK